MKQRSIIMDPFIQTNETDDFSSKSIFKTKEVQQMIYENQNPIDCTNRHLLIISEHDCGIGSQIHVHGLLLGYALEYNWTAVWSKNVNYAWPNSVFCNDTVGFDCFFERISKCEESDAKNASYLHKIKPERLFIPHQVKTVLNRSSLAPENWFFYWRIMSTLYMVRFNNKTHEYMNNIRNQMLRNPRDEYDFFLHVRHGDKAVEMKLIDTKNYLKPILMMQKLLQRNLSILVSSEDPSAINYFVENEHLFESVSYFDYPRSNEGYMQNRGKYFDVAMKSFANIRESQKAKMIIGTFGSNWNRLVFELHQTHLIDTPYPYFEVGCQACITQYQCRKKNQTYDLDW
ncbi:hypothetical protein TRFO_08003 [Tritrichomonas foetus]|uniref:Uncharacterized protein n=1 Tax=Tritrichomonas foetus TaxID=1144522 RepID=A0A1J4JMJ6_9EUKA|nr:hypothetical protein TRFO_08003 [Tritrichomonas foetus]|eukprot:OHT00335.1 hypothetical protein TRFO_08003 [Tritrichomonas foetus]